MLAGVIFGSVPFLPAGAASSATAAPWRDVSGYVTDATSGIPLAAVVQATWSTPWGTMTNRTTTNASGFYTLGVGPSTVALEANATDGEHTARDESVYQGTENATYNFPLLGPRDGVVEGRVTDASTHSPIADAQVTLNALPPQRPAFMMGRNATGMMPFMLHSYCCISNTTTTDAQGDYKILTWAGNYSLSFGAPGYDQEYTSVNVTSGRTVTVNHSLGAFPRDLASLAGTVVDAQSGAPIPYAGVSVSDPAWSQNNWTQTDAEGHFSVRTVAGSALVEVYATHYPPSPGCVRAGGCAPNSPPHSYYTWVQSYRLVNGTLNVTIHMSARPDPTQAIEGYVIDETTGRPMPNVSVTLSNEDSGLYAGGAADANGSYRIMTFPGHLVLSAWWAGRQNATTFVLDSTSSVVRLDLILPPGGTHFMYYSPCCHGEVMAPGVAASGPATFAPAAPGSVQDGASVPLAGSTANAGNLQSASVPGAFVPSSLGAYAGAPVTQPAVETSSPGSAAPKVPALPWSAAIGALGVVAWVSAARRRT
ncbi:MAG: carboxypeptidase regulatory-like domain-containing protein [Thermoplasmatota archaeon]